MLSLLFGLLAVAGGLWGMRHWFREMIYFLKGMVPISLFFAGFIAIIAGLSRSNSKQPPAGSKKA